MGKRGPQPTPSAIKQARGTYRPDRAAGGAASGPRRARTDDPRIKSPLLYQLS